MKNRNFKFKSLKFLLLSVDCVCLILLLFAYFSIKPNLVMASGSSMLPTIKSGNAIIFEKQKSYDIFNIICFRLNGVVFTHRIIDIKTENNTTLYICSGDNVALTDVGKSFLAKHEYVKNLPLVEARELSSLQIVSETEILGRVKTNSAFLGLMINLRVLILATLGVPIIAFLIARNKKEVN